MICSEGEGGERGGNVTEISSSVCVCVPGLEYKTFCVDPKTNF